MDIFRVTVEQENAKISQYSKTAKQKCAKETKRKRVKEFLLRFTQSRDTFVEFIFWNIFSFLFLEYHELEQEEKKEKSKCKCREGMSGVDMQRELDTKRESVSIRD